MTLVKALAELTENFISSQSAEDQTTIGESFVGIMATDYDANALREGDTALDFTLPDANGGETTLKALLAKGPLVINFYRGGWCPFCNLEFKALSDILPEIEKRGATLVGITPELPDVSKGTVEKFELTFNVLSDVGNKVAKEYGILMDVPESMRPLYDQWGLDVPAYNGDDSWDLPIPATYVIGTDGKIRFAYINKNYTERLEPSEILTALDAI